MSEIEIRSKKGASCRRLNGIVMSSSCHRHVITCVCIFVNASCKYFTSIQTHPSEKASASSCHRHVIASGQHATTECEICSLKCTCYSDCFQLESFEIRSCMSCHHASACEFCKRILQIFYLYTNASIRKKATSRPVHGIPDFISFIRARNPVF
jgi:hypothetical protein